MYKINTYGEEELEVWSWGRGTFSHLLLSLIVDCLHFWAESFRSHCTSVDLFEGNALMVEALEVVLLKLIPPEFVERLLCFQPLFLLRLQSIQGTQTAIIMQIYYLADAVVYRTQITNTFGWSFPSNIFTCTCYLFNTTGTATLGLFFRPSMMSWALSP